MPDKIAAATQLAKMCGWHAPDKIELDATDTLTAFVQSLRQADQRRRDGQYPSIPINGQDGSPRRLAG